MSPESSPFVISASHQSLDSPPSENLTADEFESDTEPSVDAQFPQASVQDTDATESVPSESTKPIRKVLWAVLGLAGLGALGWLIQAQVLAPGGGSGKPDFGPMAVSIGQPKVSTVQDSADFIATLESRESITVRPQAEGRISQVFVQTGDRVTAGVPLLRLDAEVQQAQVAGSQANIDVVNADIAAAQADVESARQMLVALQASLASRQADLTFRQQEFTRFKRLQEQGAASLQILQEKQSDLNQAKADIAEQQAQIRTQEAAIARAQADVVRQKQRKDAAIATANQDQAQLRYFTVAAPIDGIVGDIPAKVGDLVNQSNALLTVTQNQALEVNIEIPQEQVERLQIGMPVQLLDNSGTVLQTGKISSIAPDVSPLTQSVQVKARFTNSNGQLRTNQMMKTRIIWANRPAILVPMTAISRLAGKNFVFVSQKYSESTCANQAPQGPSPKIDPNQWVAVQKPVELGPIVENKQDIAQGLRVSDRIITSGLLQLQHCMPIQPNP